MRKMLLIFGLTPRLSKMQGPGGEADTILNRLTRWQQTLQQRITPSKADSIDADTPETLSALDDVRRFTATEIGSGVFGHWQLDSFGLPGYRYEIDQYADLRARYPNSQGLDRRDHWYPIGNDRITALASNDGHVQFYSGERGSRLLNRFDDGASPDDWIDGLQFIPSPIRAVLARISLQVRLWRQKALLARWQANHPGDTNFTALAMDIQDHMADELRTRTRGADDSQHYAGGFGYIDDGTECWSTAYRYRPKAALTRRVFGLGYFETETTYRDVRVVRRVYAPYGDDPALLADVVIRNLSDQPKTLRHYEYWDLNNYQIKANWFQTGLPALASIDARYAINDEFAQSVTWDAAQGMLRSHLDCLDKPAHPPQEPSDVDWYPADVFLIDLQGRPSACYTDTKAFFGAGGPHQPDAVAKRLDGEGRLHVAGSASGQPFCMVQRRDLTLAPGEVVQLRYAYGTVHADAQPDFLKPHRLTRLEDSLAVWKDHLVYFSTGDTPEVHREMAWHTYCLHQASIYNAFYDAHVLVQGSAYLFLHGLDGAPRDQALFSMPMTYIRPDLARETLTLLMAMAYANSNALPYAFSGYGKLNSALIHNRPSDLDLFLLLALSEYLAATGDMAFLDQKVPFYPAHNMDPITVLDHARAAFDHLMRNVGIGDNGLIRVGDGDWSDAIVIETSLSRLFLGVSFEKSSAHGESIPNTQMALYVLPLTANVLESRAPDLAKAMRDVVPKFKTAVERQWAGRWYNRAILRDVLDRGVVIGKYALNLEAQPWGLISGAAADSGYEETLIKAIDEILDARAPTGAPYTENGRVSAAISQLLTWGYSRSRPDLAWRSLLKQSFFTRGKVFPAIWFGLWTAPDTLNGVTGDYPGGTWASPVTPTTDFPAMNSNPHAMALLALIRLCGLEPAADGLRITPHLPKKQFILDLPLIRLEVAPTRIQGEYRAVNDGKRTLYITLPNGAQSIAASINGSPVDVTGQTASISLAISFQKGDRVPFSVSWLPPERPAALVNPLNPVQEVRL